MFASFKLAGLLVAVGATLVITGPAGAQQPYVQLSGAACVTPPVLHCPDKDCPSDRVINQGQAVEMKTRRASKYSCGTRGAPTEVVDTKAGYVYDSTRQNPPVPAWGLLPRPGRAEVYVYPNCQNGRVVADVVRLEKGHTEGLEPNVTEALVSLMLSARGGKISQSPATAGR